MKRTALFTSLSVATFSLGVVVLSAGCVAGQEGTDQQSSAQSLGHEHMMLVGHQATAKPEQASGPTGAANPNNLAYYGGPVIQHVNVVPVFWNANVAYKNYLEAFYSGITTGPVMSFLSQYSTTSPAQTIGNGTRGTPYTDNQTSTNVTDAAVQARLNALFTAGKLPAPNNNNLYMVHFPPGVSVTNSQGQASCSVFCAYHGTYKRNNQDVYYGIMPDQGSGGCQNGCGSSSIIARNTTEVASHEFAEAVTDAAVGLATTISAPLAWYNSAGGEIGDLCNGVLGYAKLGDGNTYAVQQLWSNKVGACVTP